MQINSKAVLAGFFTDITGRKQAEEKIKESNERYSELFEQSKDAILLIDFKGNLFGANKAVKELTGYNGQELLKMKVSDFWPAAENTKLRVLFRKSLEKGGIQTEAHLLTKGRTIKNIEISARVIKLKENSFVQTIIKDVSKQKSAEDRYRVLYESSRDAIMTLEPPKWAFTSGNPATIKMFKAKNEKDFTSRGPWEVSPKYQPDGQLSAAKAKKMIMKAMKEGSNFFEWTHKRINGEDFKATVLLTRAKIGDKTFLQATVRDMTVMR
jgi:PAS domain S-box-containing protein